MMKPKVYFTKDVSPEVLVKMYDALGIKLPGKVAVKLHSGEKGNPNYLCPEFVKPLVDHVNGTVVECNTAYAGQRDTTEKHIKLMEEHGWSKYFDVDIMDADGEVKLDIPDWSKYFDVDIMDADGEVKLDIPNGLQIKEDYVGKNLMNYDSMVVMSHFKGHPMGGFGGALKQLSIGCASSHGKLHIHCVGTLCRQGRCSTRYVQGRSNRLYRVYGRRRQCSRQAFWRQHCLSECYG